MANFGSLFENMDYQKKLSKETEERRAVESIQQGLNITEDFWKDFMMLCNNPDALGALLGVPNNKIIEWRGRIGKFLRKHYEKEELVIIQKKKKLVNSQDYLDFM